MTPEFDKALWQLLQRLEDRADDFPPLRVNLKLLLCILRASQMERYDLEPLVNSDCFEISWNNNLRLVYWFCSLFLVKLLKQEELSNLKELLVRGYLCCLLWAEQVPWISRCSLWREMIFFRVGVQSITRVLQLHHLLWRHLPPLVGCTGSLLLK